MSEVFNLDRAQREAENIDAFGKKWKVIVNRQNGLCHARPEPDREDAVIPKVIDGQWTKPSLLLDQIKKHVTKSWDMAEAATAKAERKLQAEKENAQNEATEARRKAEADNDAKPTGRAKNTRSKKESKEEKA